MRRRNFSTSCLTENSSVRFAIGTKFRPLLRTDFSESVSGRFSGIVTTDSHSYLLHSSSYPYHVKNSIPYSQFLRIRRLCSDDSDFSNKSKEMCQFFEKRGYPASVIQAALNKLIDSQHYKRRKRKRMTEFHSPSHFTLTITQ